MNDRAHSIYAPSSAHRWMICGRSIVYDHERIPEQPPFKATTEGIDAHWLGEQCLKTGRDAQSFYGRVMPSGARVTKDFVDYVQGYVDFVRARFKALGGFWRIEERVHMPKIDPLMFGSADVIHVTSERQLNVYDLKYGHWVVEVEDNEQMMSYAIGALNDYRRFIDLSKPVLAHICQPRPNHPDGKFRTVEFSIDQLIQFGKDAKAAIARSKDPNCAYVVGEHCGLCRREFLCPELNKLGRMTFI